MQYKPDVEATELALAFPLPPDLAVLPLARVRCKTSLAYHKNIYNSVHKVYEAMPIKKLSFFQ